MLIPDNINDFNSQGEKLLYLKFKHEDTDDLFILHSLFTNYHFRSISGELDFLILVPGKGIFAIEVKHGQVLRKDGYWYYANKKGEISKQSHGPFVQVNATMHSIRKYILDKIKNDKNKYDRYKKILWGTAFACIDT